MSRDDPVTLTGCALTVLMFLWLGLLRYVSPVGNVDQGDGPGAQDGSVGVMREQKGPGIADKWKHLRLKVVVYSGAAVAMTAVASLNWALAWFLCGVMVPISVLGTQAAMQDVRDSGGEVPGQGTGPPKTWRWSSILHIDKLFLGLGCNPLVMLHLSCAMATLSGAWARHLTHRGAAYVPLAETPMLLFSLIAYVYSPLWLVTLIW